MSADDTMMRLLEEASAQSAEVLSPAAAWRDHAACRGLHPDLFYPPTTAEQERVAAQYCAECSARLGRDLGADPTGPAQDPAPPAGERGADRRRGGGQWEE